MQKIIFLVSILFSTLAFGQKTPTANLTTGEVVIKLSSGRQIFGRTKYKIVLLDSVANKLGISEVPANRVLFFNKTHSYVESIISEPASNGHTVKRRYIIRINNSDVDFKTSVGHTVLFSNQSAIAGFGKHFITQDIRGEARYSLEQFAKVQKTSNLLGLASGTATTAANIIYINTAKNPKVSSLIALNLIGTGITIYAIARHLDSYKFIKRWNYYKEAIPLQEIKF